MAMTTDRLQLAEWHAHLSDTHKNKVTARLIRELIAEVRLARKNEPHESSLNRIKLNAVRASVRQVFAELDILIRHCLMQVEKNSKKETAISAVAGMVANQIWLDHQEAETERKARRRASRARKKRKK